MQNIYDEVNTLDQKCYEKYFLSEDILIEHAALGMFEFIKNKFSVNSNILIICGSGNNGADGMALARLLHIKYNVSIYINSTPKSDIAKLQEKRTKSLGLNFIDTITSNNYDVVVDCLFGSGLNKQLEKNNISLIKMINLIPSYKIACDIPSGLNKYGQIDNVCFKADTTITMGAFKKSLFSDFAKDYVGNIIKADLGIDKSLYENDTNIYLLEDIDIKLPTRIKKNTNNGSFGHLCVVLGNKKGAGLITCTTALSFGVGLVTAITKENNLPYSIMYSTKLPKNISTLAIGMGLGDSFDTSLLNIDIPILFDADILYNKIILEYLHKDNIVLTPHPKEFCALLELTDIGNISIETLQNNRFKYLEQFCIKYPNVVVVLKGANVLIQQNKTLFINPNGSANLSFGGSGDILAGLISSLMAQDYSTIDACIQGSLVHTCAANNFLGNDYSLNVNDLIEQIKIL